MQSLSRKKYNCAKTLLAQAFWIPRAAKRNKKAKKVWVITELLVLVRLFQRWVSMQNRLMSSSTLLFLKVGRSRTLTLMNHSIQCAMSTPRIIESKLTTKMTTIQEICNAVEQGSCAHGWGRRWSAWDTVCQPFFVPSRLSIFGEGRQDGRKCKSFRALTSQRPYLLLQVNSVDDWGRHRIEGYGFIRFPVEPGYHKLEVETWRPRGSLSDEIHSFFLGGGIRIQ